MYYELRIQILEAVQQLRKDDKQDSPYICDNLDEVNVSEDKEAVFSACNEIKKAIEVDINQEWSIVQWLSKRDDRDYDHHDREVVQARITMIDNLIQRYKNKLENTNETT